jgi:hypothetical protein
VVVVVLGLATVAGVAVWKYNRTDWGPLSVGVGDVVSKTTTTPATGTGGAAPPHQQFVLTVQTGPGYSLTLNMQDSSFTWVPVGVSDPGANPHPKTSLILTGCMTQLVTPVTTVGPATIQTCRYLTEAKYSLPASGELTLSWDLVAQPDSFVEPTASIPAVPGRPVPAGPCPGTLTVPPAAADQDCVVATATIVVELRKA